VKIIRGICALLLSSVLAGQAFVQTAKSKEISLLETGDDFHGDEVEARNGEKWMGLYVTERGEFLAESTLTVRRVFDPIVDEDKRKPTGKSVSVNRREKPMFLVKNAVMLKPGKVPTVYGGKNQEDFPPFGSASPVTLKLGERTYQLKVVSPKGLSPEGGYEWALPADAQLILTSGPSTQTLYPLDDPTLRDSESWSLYWAGDLDGDGKLDLYMFLSGYNFEERRLFLSSQAAPGELVKEVATFTRTGC
jgi:hypothetical protein